MVVLHCEVLGGIDFDKYDIITWSAEEIKKSLSSQQKYILYLKHPTNPSIDIQELVITRE